MLKLYSKQLKALSAFSPELQIVRISTNPNLPEALRSKEILLFDFGNMKNLPEGFAGYFTFNKEFELPDEKFSNVFVLPEDQKYLADGDVIRFDPSKGSIRSIYRRNSEHNSFLVTERCNNFCLMCSQPPKEIDDSYIVNELLQAIPLVSRNTREIGLTGGEPTLLGEDFARLVRSLKNYLPQTTVHVLSNGRNFSKTKFTRSVADVGHPDLMIGIPLYSDVSQIHDYVVQADGAYDETIRGILNLKQHGVKVEIRVVIHKQTFARLPQLAEFISRNLLFVDHVALMGLEMMGFTKYNLEELWIDPGDYQDQLEEAVQILARNRVTTSIYNHQLCVLKPGLWPWAKKSISDWKNEYMPECEPCQIKEKCGGFFSSAKLRYSSHITPVLS